MVWWYFSTVLTYLLVRISRDKMLGLVRSLLRKTPLFNDLVEVSCPFTCRIRPGTHSPFTLQSNFQWLSFEASPAERGSGWVRLFVPGLNYCFVVWGQLILSFGAENFTSFLDLEHSISTDNKTSNIWTQKWGDLTLTLISCMIMNNLRSLSKSHFLSQIKGTKWDCSTIIALDIRWHLYLESKTGNNSMWGCYNCLLINLPTGRSILNVTFYLLSKSEIFVIYFWHRQWRYILQ